MSDRILNLAYLGNGKSTNRYHIPFVLERPDKFRVKSVWERHPGTSSWTYLEGVNYTDSLEDILNDPAIDIVVVSTPVMHYEYTKQALLAGKHVICEKPFTKTAAQAEELFALAQEKGLFLTTYQNRRFDSDYLTVKKVVASGKLGEVYEINEHYDYWRPEYPKMYTDKSKMYIDKFGYDVSLSMVYGHGVHTVDQAVAWFGTPDSISCDARQLGGPGTFNDMFDIDMHFGKVKYSVHGSYYRVKPRPSFTVYGTRGMFVKETQDRQEEFLKAFKMPDTPGFGIDLPEHFGTLTYVDDEGRICEEKVPSVAGDYGRMYDNAYDVVVNGAEQEVRPEQTIAMLHILEEAVKGLKA
jgi:predicted dehydrogenase